MRALQADYELHMVDYVAWILEGTPVPDGENFTEVDYFDPLARLGHLDRSKMGLCTQTLLRELERDPLLWQRYAIREPTA